MRSLTLILAVGLVALAAPTVQAQPGPGDDPCICDPQPCGTPPSPVADPDEWFHDVVCNTLGGEPW